MGSALKVNATVVDSISTLGNVFFMVLCLLKCVGRCVETGVSSSGRPECTSTFYIRDECETKNKMYILHGSNKLQSESEFRKRLKVGPLQITLEWGKQDNDDRIGRISIFTSTNIIRETFKMYIFEIIFKINNPKVIF